jgi:UDP-glucuronate 4-epimerase
MTPAGRKRTWRKTLPAPHRIASATTPPRRQDGRPLALSGDMGIPTRHVLVTGAAGFIGSHLVERLLADGVVVIGVDNFDPFYAAAEKRRNLAAVRGHPRFALLEVDCSDTAALDAHIPRIAFDAIVHLAARAGVRPSLEDPTGYIRANVLGTQAVLDLARERDIGRIVFGSSSSVYGDSADVPFRESMDVDAPISPYAATKRAAELLCVTHAHLYGASIAALRFFTVYGPRQRPDLAIRRFATRMLAGSEIELFGDGTTSRDYTWIDDIIDGIVGALAWTQRSPSGCEAFNLGGRRTTPLARLVTLLESALGVRARVAHRPCQPGDVTRTWADTSKAERFLGYAPRIGIDEGIPRFAEWMLERDRHRTTAAFHSAGLALGTR